MLGHKFCQKHIQTTVNVILRAVKIYLGIEPSFLQVPAEAQQAERSPAMECISTRRRIPASKLNDTCSREVCIPPCPRLLTVPGGGIWGALDLPVTCAWRDFETLLLLPRCIITSWKRHAVIYVCMYLCMYICMHVCMLEACAHETGMLS